MGKPAAKSLKAGLTGKAIGIPAESVPVNHVLDVGWCRESVTMRITPGLLVTFLSLAAICCGAGPISDSIGVTVARGVGTRLALSDHAKFAWDKVCVLGPYTPDENVDALTGIPGASARAYDIRSNDGINVLMLVDRGRVAESVAHSRGMGDFGPELVGKCYSRDQAVFVVRTPPPRSWGNIGPM